jgi:hypothetical protein
LLDFGIGFGGTRATDLAHEVSDALVVFWVRPDFQRAQALLAQPRAVGGYAGG